MKFETLHLKNFCSFKEATLRLADRGLVLILGENLDAPKADSNGSGKSLIFDALCWCLWGQTVRGIKGDAVVSRKAKKNCVVTTIFSEGETQYKVIRHQKDKEHFKKNDLEFFVNDRNACGTSIAETQKLVNAALGLDFLTGRSLMPGAGIKAAELTDKAIKELLERLLQTELLAEAHTVTKEKIKAVTLQRDGQSLALTKYRSDLSMECANVEDYTKRSTSFQSDRDKHGAEIVEAIKVAEANIDSLTMDVVAATKASARVQALTDLVNHAKKCISTNQSAWQKEFDAWQIAKHPLAKKVQQLKWEIEKLSEGLPDEEVCPACHRDIAESHREEHAEKRRLEIAKIEKQIDEANSKMAELHNDVMPELDSRKVIISEWEKDRAASSAELQKVRSKAATLAQSERYLKVAREDLATKKLALQKSKEVTNPFLDLIDQAQQKCSKLEELVRDTAAEVEKYNKELEELDFWLDGFSPKGMRSQMLKHITPILNDRAKHYCDILTDNAMQIQFQTEKLLKNGKIKEDFNIIVKLANGSDSYAGCSGGEKARADLVISLVLGDLASFRANKKIPFRFLDEAFERVDDAGLDAVVHLLNEQKHETIFVITHKSELKQYFSKSITVTKENGISTMEDT